jgi:outer membrane protein
MKRVIVMLVIALMGSAVTVNAQKIGHINTGELLAVMPETKKAQEKFQKSQDSLNNVYAELIKEFREQDSIFGADSAKWTPAKRDIKRNDLGNLYTKVQGYQNEAQQYLQQREQEVFTPVQKVALEAIQTVAKANGYTYIFNKEVLYVSPTADDILPLVKKYLKIADTPAK